MPGVAPVNTGDPELEYAFYEAERRVLGIQAKLHRWARDDPYRRFEDLYNLVCDPAFLLVAWVRVRSNKGARSAGVDGWSAGYIQATGLQGVLAQGNAWLKAGILCEDGVLKDTEAGPAQVWVLSALLSNVALAVLGEHIARAPGGPHPTPYQRVRRRRLGLPNYRLIRYADDW